MAAHLLSLPAEALGMIFGHLPRNDLFPLRLTCKTFEAAINRLAFAEVHLSFTPESFEAMRKLSKSDKLREYIRTVLYDGSTLTNFSMNSWLGDEEVHFVVWGECIKLPDTPPLLCLVEAEDESPVDVPEPDQQAEHTHGAEDESPEAHEPDQQLENIHRVEDESADVPGQQLEHIHSADCWYTEEVLRSMYQDYLKYVERIRNWSSRYQDFSVLASSWAGFPNLRDVQIVTNDAWKWHNGFVDHNGKEGWYRQFEAFESTVFRAANVVSGEALVCGMIEEPALLSGLRQVQSIFSTLDVLSINLQHLHIDKLYWQNLDLLEQNADLFAGLKSIDLQISDWADHNTGARTYERISQEGCYRRQRFLGKALANAKDLEHLALTFDRKPYAQNHEDHRWIALSQIVGSTTWKRLEHLELRNLDIVGPHFGNFLARHSGTLASIRMREVTTVKMPWARIMPHIQSLPRLEAFRLEDAEILYSHFYLTSPAEVVWQQGQYMRLLRPDSLFVYASVMPENRISFATALNIWVFGAAGCRVHVDPFGDRLTTWPNPEDNERWDGTQLHVGYCTGPAKCEREGIALAFEGNPEAPDSMMLKCSKCGHQWREHKKFFATFPDGLFTWDFEQKPVVVVEEEED